MDWKAPFFSPKGKKKVRKVETSKMCQNHTLLKT